MMTPKDLAEWLYEVEDGLDGERGELMVDIGPDHTLLVISESGEWVAERTVVRS